MMWRVSCFAYAWMVTVSLSLPAAAKAVPDRDGSWGKAGIDFDAYRRDAMECGIGGAKVDIAHRQDTRDVLDGTHNQDRAIDSANIRSFMKGSVGLDPEEVDRMTRDYSSIYKRSIRGGVKRTQSFMEDAVVTCLRARGYVPFRLTRAQVKARDRLRMGTLERRRYLYDLASDPAILRDQAVERERPAER